MAQKARRTAAVSRLIVPALAAAVGLAAVAAGTQPDPASTPEATAPTPRVDREGFPLPAEAVARVGSARLRHGRQLQGLGYSPDGTLLATCGGAWFDDDGLLRLWDARTGKLLWQTSITSDNNHSECPFSADGKTVVVVDNETCRWFDARSGRHLADHDFIFPDQSGAWRLGPHGTMLAVVSGGQTEDLAVYDLPTGKERFRKSADGFFWFDAPVFSADGKTLAMMEAPGKPGHSGRFRARLFDLTTGGQITCFEIGEHYTGLALSSDGKCLAAHNASGKTVRVWSVPDGKLLHQFETDVNSTTTVAFTPDGKSVVAGSQDLHAVRIDLATGKVSGRYRSQAGSDRLTFTRDGKRLAIGIGDGKVSQWDLATGKRLDASADLAALHSVHFDAAGRVLQFWDDAVVGVDWRTGREVRRVTVPFEGYPHLVYLSPDLSRVAVYHDIWDAASGKEVEAVNIPTGPWDPKTFSADGKTLYYADWEQPVGAWDVEAGKYLPAFDRKPRHAAALAVSADGHRLAVAEYPEDLQKGKQHAITMWDTAGRRELRRLLPPEGAEVRALVLSPEGNYLAVVGIAPRESGGGEHGLVEVWDTRTGKEWLLRTDLPDPVITLAFSGDGRVLATGSRRGALTLWELATRQERHQFAGHENAVQEVTFSRGDKFLASVSCDAPVFVWDVEGRDGKPPSAVPFTAEEGAGLWQALNDAKATTAFDAMRQLLTRPGPAVALLRERLKPARTTNEEGVRRLLRDLDADNFAVRDRASAELELLADRAAPALRKALEGKPSEEVKRRVGQLLESASPGGPGRRREVRAVEVAERIRTAEARQLLDTWAGGDTSALLTQEARAAAERLKGR
jgi:WD40 repeat protein